MESLTRVYLQEYINNFEPNEQHSILMELFNLADDKTALNIVNLLYSSTDIPL